MTKLWEFNFRNIWYGAPAFALGIPTIPLLVYLPAIYADDIGLGLSVTGISLFIARFFDIISDPLIGIFAQKISTPWGRWKPLIFCGGIIAAIGVVLLLNPPLDATFVYLITCSIILYLGWTLINIPYLAWGSSLSKSYFGRTKVTSIREGFMLAGIVFAGSLPALAISLGYTEKAAISFVGWIVIIIGIILFAILLIMVDEPIQKSTNIKISNLEILSQLKKNKPFRLLLLGWFFNSLANGIPAVLFILFMKYILGADALERGILSFAYFFSGIIGIPVWIWLSKNLGKHQTWCFAMIIAVIGFSFVPFLGQGDFIYFLIITILTGLTLGADLAIPPSMQADVAEYGIIKNGNDNTVIMFAIWSAITKIAFALSVLIAFLSLEIIGFELTDKEYYSANPLSLIYGVSPVVFKIVSIWIIAKNPLTYEYLSKIRNNI